MFYSWDLSGNLAQQVDPGGGGVLGSAAIDAYGLTVTTNTSGDPFSFLGGQFGYYTDTQAENKDRLTLCTHRFYDTTTGRFLTRDPIGYKGGVNLYGFTRNNPVNRSDPSGFLALDSVDAAIQQAISQSATDPQGAYSALQDLLDEGDYPPQVVARIQRAMNTVKQNYNVNDYMEAFRNAGAKNQFPRYNEVKDLTVKQCEKYSKYTKKELQTVHKLLTDGRFAKPGG